MRGVMIDIESMSTRPDALILSIGAVGFQLFSTGVVLADSFFRVLDVREQLALGRHVSEDTAKWWMAQSTDARMHWVKPPLEDVVSASQALDELDVYLQINYGLSDGVWANGAHFDVVALETLCASVGRKVPWRYNIVRDARTIYKEFPGRNVTWELKDQTAHDPVADCVYQVPKLFAHWPAKLPDPPPQDATT